MFEFIKKSGLQAIFDRAYKGLAKQGFVQSAWTGTGCRYRGPNGLKCAAGHCISDEDYHEDMEWKLISLVLDGLGIDDEKVRFIQDLQSAHDNSNFADTMDKELAKVAGKYGLVVPTIQGRRIN